jgi:hypothetical protein
MAKEYKYGKVETDHEKEYVIVGDRVAPFQISKNTKLELKITRKT